jgi:hypothetical protein
LIIFLKSRFYVSEEPEFPVRDPINVLAPIHSPNVAGEWTTLMLFSMEDLVSVTCPKTTILTMVFHGFHSAQAAVTILLESNP